MGQDGARVVTVNSVGREIREVLRRDEPGEGKRVQLTIDADVQRAAEEGFRIAGYNGSAVMLDPRNGEILALASVPAFDPNDFASGIAAQDLGPADDRPAEAAAEPRHAGPLRAGVGVQDCGRGRRSRRRADHAGDATSSAAAARPSTAASSSATSAARTTASRCAVRSRSRATSTSTRSATCSASIACTSGRRRSASARCRASTCRSEIQGIMPSTAWKRQKYNEKWYAGETISVSIGQGQVSVTPISLAVMAMTVANGGTRHQPHLVRAIDDGNGGGWKPFPAPKPRSVAQHEAVDDRRRARRSLDGGERRRHRAAAPWSKAATSPARPARRRSSRTRASCAPARPAATCATTASSSSSPRRRTPRSPAWSSPSTPSTARAPPRSRST